MASQASRTTAAIAAHLYAHADRYFPEQHAPAAVVRLLRQDVRPYAHLCWFSLRSGGVERVVIAKISVAPPDLPVHSVVMPDRPRVAVCAGPETAFVLEYHALARIHDHFSRLGDPRFGTVRVFEMLPEHRAVVMEAVDAPNLRQLVLRHGAQLSLRGFEAMREAFWRGGAWLAAYHTLAPQRPLEVPQTRRSDFVDYVQELSVYLSDHLRDQAFFARVRDIMVSAARDHLPEVLPTGVAHGDYAMRNILVGKDRRIIVLDTAARYRTAVYRDIASLLADLHVSRLSAWGRGALFHPLRIASYRQAFLSGYFGSTPVPEVVIRLYVALALLERWSAEVARCSLAGGAGLPRVKLSLLSRFFRGLIRGRLQECVGPWAAPPAVTALTAERVRPPEWPGAWEATPPADRSMMGAGTGDERAAS